MLRRGALTIGFKIIKTLNVKQLISDVFDERCRRSEIWNVCWSISTLWVKLYAS